MEWIMDVSERFHQALKEQKKLVDTYMSKDWRHLFETVRAADDIFCRELILKESMTAIDRMKQSIMGWGINEALLRIVPESTAHSRVFQFRSVAENRKRVDDFLLEAGFLSLGQRFFGWLQDGLVSAKIRQHPESKHAKQMLVIKTSVESTYDEMIGLDSLRWRSFKITIKNRKKEREISKIHSIIQPKMQSYLLDLGEFGMSYTVDPEIDDLFFEMGKIYIERIYSQDLIGDNDKINGYEFSRYKKVLASLSGRAQKHISFSMLSLENNDRAHLRTILTTWAPLEQIEIGIAGQLGGYQKEISDLLSPMILSDRNVHYQHNYGHQMWPPLIKLSRDDVLLPIFGLDINPFLFMLAEMKRLYPNDWFSVANNRESRWIDELNRLFSAERYIVKSNLAIKEKGRILTDIDYVVFDRRNSEIMIIQLKWQEPVGFSNRQRRSHGRNMVESCDKWASAVTTWISQEGLLSLSERLGLKRHSIKKAHLVVIGRYWAHLSGMKQNQDLHLIDWNMLVRVMKKYDAPGLEQILTRVRREISELCKMKVYESTVFRLGEMGVIVNPESEPKD